MQAGDLDAKNRIEPDDEIGVLAGAINAMVDRLRDNNSRSRWQGG
ncbi:MAG: HAMP domain-containing protein [Myxococcota bacterium]